MIDGIDHASYSIYKSIVLSNRFKHVNTVRTSEPLLFLKRNLPVWQIFPTCNIWLCACYILWQTESKMQEFYYFGKGWYPVGFTAPYIWIIFSSVRALNRRSKHDSFTFKNNIIGIFKCFATFCLECLQGWGICFSGLPVAMPHHHTLSTEFPPNI